MSLKSRANNLQALTDLTHAQAVQIIRDLGDQPAKLAEKWNWPLTRCDAYLHDPNLDPDYRAALEGGGESAHAQECENCWQYFFVAWSRDEGELEDRRYCRDCSGGEDEDEECMRCHNPILASSESGLCEGCASYVDSR